MADEKSSSANKGLIAGVIGVVAVVVVAIFFCINVLGRNIAGTYKLHSYISDGKETTELVELMEKAGVTMTLELKSDKTGTMKTTGGTTSEGESDNVEYKFKYDDNKFTIEEDGQSESIEYKVDGDFITITFEGETMKFKKTK